MKQRISSHVEVISVGAPEAGPGKNGVQELKRGLSPRVTALGADVQVSWASRGTPPNLLRCHHQKCTEAAAAAGSKPGTWQEVQVRATAGLVDSAPLCHQNSGSAPCQLCSVPSLWAWSRMAAGEPQHREGVPQAVGRDPLLWGAADPSVTSQPLGTGTAPPKGLCPALLMGPPSTAS